MNIILIYFAMKYEGDWDKIYQALDQKEKVSLKEITELEEKTKTWKEHNYNFKTLLDVDYPKQFKEAYKPPFVFWYKGNLDLLKSNATCLATEQVGASDEVIIEKSLKTIKSSAQTLINFDKTRGDDEIFTAAQNMNIKQILVANEGLKNLLPVNDKSLLIISEYPEDFKPIEEKAHVRDRLVASLANELVLISSSKQNHDRLVADFLNLGKEINCFPREATSNDYNNELIKQGANLVTSIKFTKEHNREIN